MCIRDRWIDSCVDGEAKAAYDIHFEDTEGNRIGANGVSAVSYTHLQEQERQEVPARYGVWLRPLGHP